MTRMRSITIYKMKRFDQLTIKQVKEIIMGWFEKNGNIVDEIISIDFGGYNSFTDTDGHLRDYFDCFVKTDGHTQRYEFVWDCNNEIIAVVNLSRIDAYYRDLLKRREEKRDSCIHLAEDEYELLKREYEACCEKYDKLTANPVLTSVGGGNKGLFVRVDEPLLNGLEFGDSVCVYIEKIEDPDDEM